MTVTVSELKNAEPAKWRDAADDMLRAAKHCELMAQYARDEVADTLKQCWVGDTGEAARRRFVKHAGEFEAAAKSLRWTVHTYDHLAGEIAGAQRDLTGAIDYAHSHGLKIDESGRAHRDDPGKHKSGEHSASHAVRHIQPVLDDALEKANRADTAAARDLRTAGALTQLTSPGLVDQALKKDSPLAIALRLNGGLGGLHPINVSPSQIAAVNRASAETGTSRRLLLSVLWQEQQWYQNYGSPFRGPLTGAGHLLDWWSEETVKPDKSLGITHMKLQTARDVITRNREAFTASNGKSLNDLSDAQLTKYVEENPDENIRLSAYHLRDLKENPHGAGSDKSLFTLYAADTPDVREKNEQFGDESSDRGGDIRTRSENWDRIQPHISDAQAWENLSPAERSNALSQLESQTPRGHSLSLEPIYPVGGPGPGTGTGPPEPGTPSPSPGTPPKPPGESD